MAIVGTHIRLIGCVIHLRANYGNGIQMLMNNRLLRILILEDDSAEYRLIAKRLSNRRYEFQTTWVRKLGEAIDLLRSQNYDAILTDLSVPDSSGYDTVSKLRSHCGSSPIIVLTSLEDEHVENAVITAGGQDYLVKSDIRGNTISRAIVHAVQRQDSLNRTKRLVRKLKRSQLRLKDQSVQLQRKNKKLRKLYRTAKEFVDNVSHDLRTPLTVIKDYVSIVSGGMAGEINAEQKKLLEKTTLRADDLNHMVDDILDASKLESGLLGAWRRPVSVEKIFNHATCLLSQRASIKGIQLVVEQDQDLPEVYCDSEKAIRVITNLAINAIKHTEPGRKVVVWAKHVPLEAEVRIGITDEGPGIDQESLARIFDRFEQLEDDVKSTVKGFGLGLNIAQRLTRLNLGQLDVESEVGTGSTFSFTIPIAEPNEVFWRWLALKAKSNLPIRMVEIALDDTVTIGAANDFNRFVNCLLRKDDILFRIDDRRWLISLLIAESDVAHWEERADSDFKRFCRNRPQGHLPGFTRRLLREWQRPMSSRKVLTEFNQVLQSEFSNTSREELATV